MNMLVSMRQLKYGDYAGRARAWIERRTEHAAFLRAITAAPDDAAPKLIYADWLDEQNQEEYSEVAAVIRMSHVGFFSTKEARRYVRLRRQLMNPKRWFGPTSFSMPVAIVTGFPGFVVFETWNHLRAWLPTLGMYPFFSITCRQLQYGRDVETATGTYEALPDGTEFDKRFPWRIPFALARYLPVGVKRNDPAIRNAHIGEALVDLARELAGHEPRHNKRPLSLLHRMEANNDNRDNPVPLQHL